MMIDQSIPGLYTVDKVSPIAASSDSQQSIGAGASNNVDGERAPCSTDAAGGTRTADRLLAGSCAFRHLLDEILDDGSLSIECDQRDQRGRDERGRARLRHWHWGAEGAREELEEFWRAVAQAARRVCLAWAPLDGWVRACGLPPDYYPSYLTFHA